MSSLLNHNWQCFVLYCKQSSIFQMILVIIMKMLKIRMRMVMVLQRRWYCMREENESNLIFFNQEKLKQILQSRTASFPERWEIIDSTEKGGATIRLNSSFGLWLPNSCCSPVSRFLMQMEWSKPSRLSLYPESWWLLLNSS